MCDIIGKNNLNRLNNNQIMSKENEFKLIKNFQNGGETDKTEFQKFIEKLYKIWNNN